MVYVEAGRRTGCDFQPRSMRFSSASSAASTLGEVRWPRATRLT